MKAQKISGTDLRGNIDFREFIDFTRAGAPLPLSGYNWKFKVHDGSAWVDGTGIADEAVVGRLWLTLPKEDCATIPAGYAPFYVMGSDPANYLFIPCYGRLKSIQGGPPW
jgi:hypothetical protein